MRNLDVNQTLDQWQPLSSTLYVPHSLMEVVSVLVEKYEDENVPELTE